MARIYNFNGPVGEDPFNLPVAPPTTAAPVGPPAPWRPPGSLLPAPTTTAPPTTSSTIQATLPTPPPEAAPATVVSVTTAPQTPTPSVAGSVPRTPSYNLPADDPLAVDTAASGGIGVPRESLAALEALGISQQDIADQVAKFRAENANAKNVDALIDEFTRSLTAKLPDGGSGNAQNPFNPVHTINANVAALRPIIAREFTNQAVADIQNGAGGAAPTGRNTSTGTPDSIDRIPSSGGEQGLSDLELINARLEEIARIQFEQGISDTARPILERKALSDSAASILGTKPKSQTASSSTGSVERLRTGSGVSNDTGASSGSPGTFSGIDLPSVRTGNIDQLPLVLDEVRNRAALSGEQAALESLARQLQAEAEKAAGGGRDKQAENAAKLKRMIDSTVSGAEGTYRRTKSDLVPLRTLVKDGIAEILSGRETPESYSRKLSIPNHTYKQGNEGRTVEGFVVQEFIQNQLQDLYSAYRDGKVTPEMLSELTSGGTTNG